MGSPARTVPGPAPDMGARIGRLGLAAGLPVVIVLVALVFAWLSPAFLTADNLTSLFQRQSVIAVAALGATVVIISGGIDLSMGAVIGLSTVLITLPLAEAGIPVPITLLLALVVGALVGAATGILVTRAGIPALIATLGMLLVVRGVAAIVSDNTTISGADLPAWFLYLGRGSIGPIPVPVLIAGSLYAVTYIVMRATRVGVWTYAIGSSPDAAKLSGVAVDRHRVLVYAFGGLLSAVAGVLLCARLGSGYAQHGVGWEFEIIAAVLLGGTSIFGGRGGVERTLLGVILLGILANGLNLLNISSFYQTVATGLLLMVAVASDEYLRRHARRARADG